MVLQCRDVLLKLGLCSSVGIVVQGLSCRDCGGAPVQGRFIKIEIGLAITVYTH